MRAARNEWPVLTLLAYALAMAATSASAPVLMAQLTIRQRIVIRVPAAPVAPVPRPMPRLRWKEKDGPKCIPMEGLAAFAIVRRDAVDLMLRGGRRLRAYLDDECPALDFYSGFYIVPNADARICRNRDVIRSRIGGQCGIEKFKLLQPERPPER